MFDGRHQYLNEKDKHTYKLNPNTLDRIISRGLGQVIWKETAVKPIQPLVNSEAHLCCSDVNITTTHVAFGRRAIPKLKTELQSSDPLISKNAIITLLDMVHDPERAVEAIKLQVISRLVTLMKSEDAFVRQRVLMILEVLAMQPGGKLAIVNQNNIMNNLPDLLHDADKNVRQSAAKTILALATWYLGVNEMITRKFITTLIKQLNVELEDDIVQMLLETLELLLDQDMQAKKTALDNEGMELEALLEHPMGIIRARAAAVIGQMVRHVEGKKAIQTHRSDILATLTDLLEDPYVTVKTEAAGVLMFALCTTEAKLHCLKLPTLFNLLRCAQIFREPGLQMNAIKALTSLAESPEGQAILKRDIQQVQDIRPADNNVKRHKRTLITVINRVV